MALPGVGLHLRRLRAERELVPLSSTLGDQESAEVIKNSSDSGAYQAVSITPLMSPHDITLLSTQSQGQGASRGARKRGPGPGLRAAAVTSC